jgi:GT2 family glycosyltransferase
MNGAQQQTLQNLEAQNQTLRAQLEINTALLAFKEDFFAELGAIKKPRRRAHDCERLARLRTDQRYERSFRDAEPLISVIIPTYNRAELIIERTLPSVLAQDYENWELIIVGDAMQESDARLLQDSLDPRVRFYNLKRRGSYPSKAGPRWFTAGTKPVNVGLSIASGDWIAHLDDDDEFLPTHLSQLLSVAKEHRVEWAHSKVMFAPNEGERGNIVIIGAEHPSHGSISRISSLYHGLLKTFRYNPHCWQYAYPGDWDLWERLLEMGVSHAHLNQVTAIHHGVADGWFERYKNVSVEQQAKSNEASTEQPDNQRQEIDEQANYQQWIAKHAPQDIDLAIYNDRFESWNHQPTFHILINVKQGEQNLLADTINSLDIQLYSNWKLTVLADYDCPNPMFEDLDMLQWVQLENESRLIPTANRYIDEIKAGWVMWMTPGSQFEPQFLNVCGDYINQYPQWRLIYTDEDLIAPDGERSGPQFKPDFNLDLLRSGNYIGHAVLIQRDALLEIGGFAAKESALIYDVALKTLDLYHEQAVGHIAEMLYHHTAAIPHDTNTFDSAGKYALQSHLERNNIDIEATSGLIPGSFFIDYPLPSHPLVSVIIPTRDRLDLIKPCVDSLLAKTSYTNFEVIIMDNNSAESETLAYFASLESNDKRVRVVKYPHSYNFSAINNEAARQAQGEYLVLLNNDTIVIQDNWLERMLAHGLRAKVGAVGCRLVFPNQRLQHAGVILGMNGTADHIHINLPINEPGYMQRAQVVQNFSAVTAACLLVKKSLYFEVGGLDEEKFKVLFNDVDFCLKVGELGYKMVWTPYATLVHHGSSSLKHIQDPEIIARYRQADSALLEKWLPKLANDPAYNRHLSLYHRDSRIEVETSVSWDTNFRDRFRVLAAPFNSFGTGEYRVRAPLRALEGAGLAQCALLPDNDQSMRFIEPVELERLQPDTLLLQNADHDIYLAALECYKKFTNHIFRVFGQDDLVFQVPKKNPYRQVAPKDLKWRVRKALSLCDRLIVATAPMAEALRGMIDDICIVPNYLEDSLWQGLTSQRRVGRKPRVGWAGGEQHQGDLELILPLVKATAQEFDWVFFGMCPEVLRPHVKEVHNGVPFLEYPSKLASLNLDVAVAPLEHNRFNVAKSNLRILEYGIMGWPTICSDIEPYRDTPVVRVPNNPNAWIKAVREYAYDLDAAAVEGDKLRQWVLDNWMLSNHAEDWLQALMPH